MTLNSQLHVGARGTLQGIEWECRGVVVRRGLNEEVGSVGDDRWNEYFLVGTDGDERQNAWLSVVQGHWTLLRPSAAPSEPDKNGARSLNETTFEAFRRSKVETMSIEGEVPDGLTVGTLIDTEELIAPPQLLAREDDEWWLGEHLEPDAVWNAFALNGGPPLRVGVGACQPSPHAAVAKPMRQALLAFLVAAVVIHVVGFTGAAHTVVAEESFEWEPGVIPVTESFELTGRTANVRITTTTNVENTWAYFSYALINPETGRSLSLGSEVSYHAGGEGEAAWSEGSRTDQIVVPAVPSGWWFLRADVQSGQEELNFDVRIERDVAPQRFFLGALALILLPYGIFTYRRASFEHERWQESDL